MTTSAVDVPTDPLPSGVTSGSWFPDVALHARAGEFVHESSYAILWFAAGMFAIAIACCFIPWEERVLLGAGPKAKYIIAGGIVWGGICLVGYYYGRNAFGKRIIIRPAEGSLSIESPGLSTLVSLDNVAGIQICRERHGYQTNLVYRSDSGNLHRHGLYSHTRKGPCSDLAEQYNRHCGFAILDHTTK